jgi:hypothetical protein
MRQHKFGEYFGLVGFGTAGQLGCGRWDERYSALEKINKDVFLSGVDSESAVDDALLIQVMVVLQKFLVGVDDIDWLAGQKIISENR